MNAELEKTRVQIKAVKESLDALRQREQEILEHEREAYFINVDEGIIKDDVSPEQVNYVMGQSAGYVSGFRAAINTIVSALADEYRDIRMTETELYMLVELGEAKERAWLKDNKQRKLLEKNGWEQDFNDPSSCFAWKKKAPETGVLYAEEDD